MSASTLDVPLISAAELAQLQNDGWVGGSSDDRGLHVRDGWMCVLRRDGVQHVVCVHDDVEPTPASPISGSAMDSAPSGNSSAINSSDHPQRNAGVAEPDPALPVTVDDAVRTADCLPRVGFGRSPASPLCPA